MQGQIFSELIEQVTKLEKEVKDYENSLKDSSAVIDSYQSWIKEEQEKNESLLAAVKKWNWKHSQVSKENDELKAKLEEMQSFQNQLTIRVLELVERIK